MPHVAVVCSGRTAVVTARLAGPLIIAKEDPKLIITFAAIKKIVRKMRSLGSGAPGADERSAMSIIVSVVGHTTDCTPVLRAFCVAGLIRALLGLLTPTWGKGLQQRVVKLVMSSECSPARCWLLIYWGQTLCVRWRDVIEAESIAAERIVRQTNYMKDAVKTNFEPLRALNGAATRLGPHAISA
jgi:hypothetical protein